MLTTIRYNAEQRKLFMLAPVPVILCLLLVFHGLGGGKSSAASADSEIARGVNKNLPSARPDSSTKTPDKMQIYAMAAADSVRFREQQKRDPNITPSTTPDQILKKVEQLKLKLHKPEQLTPDEPNFERTPITPRFSPPQIPVEPNRTAARDPEMEHIDAMLDKIIRIQHPELVTVDTASKPRQTFVLERPSQPQDAASLLQTNTPSDETATGFIEISDEDKPDTGQHAHDPALEATVDGDQTVTAGSTLTLQLSGPAVINGLAVPSGQQLYGEISVSNQRLNIHISSLRIGDQVVPVSLQVYDLDGLPGIRVPGALTREISKESASAAVSGLGLASMDPSLTGQAANAGLQLAKSLTSRKIGVVRVQLPAGYHVLLVNTKTK